MSRKPKPDAQQPGTAQGAGVDEVWLVDTEGGVVLVAQEAASQLDLAVAEGNASLDAEGGPEAATHAYDGHVPLVLAALELAGVDVTFDVLANSLDLFDVPALDSPAPAGDASGT